MSKFCHNCGAELKDDAKFCTSCGQKIAQDSEQVNAVANVNNTVANASNPVNNVNNSVQSFNHSGITNRSIPLAIILSLVTCGIYLFYWQAKLTDETNELLGKTNATSGILAVILTIVTCCIYGIYWAYKIGENVDSLKGKNGDTGILYVILFFLGLGIIPMALAQDAINDKVEKVY